MKLCKMSSIFPSVAFLLFSSGRTFSTAVVTLLLFFYVICVLLFALYVPVSNFLCGFSN